MWVTAHTLSGAALGSALPAPAALPGALLLHAGLDVIPHWDYTACSRRMTWAELDVGASVALVAGLAALGARRGVLASAALSALPDLDSLEVLLPGSGQRQIFPAHWARFPHGSCGKRCGQLTHLAVIATSLTVLALAWGRRGPRRRRATRAANF